MFFHSPAPFDNNVIFICSQLTAARVGLACLACSVVNKRMKMPPFARENNLLVYKGNNFLKQRLLLSTLSGKPVKIIEIRSEDANLGLREYEISLIRLFDKITNGTKIELNESGTSLYFCPGLLHGGAFHHDCCTQRGIGKKVEYLKCAT